MHRYILRETIVSMVINTLFSLAFFLLVFTVGAPVRVWGVGGYAFDALPQSAAIAAMSTLVPGFIAMRQIRAGRLARRNEASILPRNIWLRAVVVAMAAMALGGALSVAGLMLLGLRAIPWEAALIAKLAYGAALAGIVTPPTLRAALVQD